MRRHHHGPRVDLVGALLDLNAPDPQVGKDGLVMDEVAEDGQWFVFGRYPRRG